MVYELMRFIIPQTTQHYWATQPYPSGCGFRPNESHSPHPPGHSQEVLPPDSELAAMGKGAARKPAISLTHCQLSHEQKLCDHREKMCNPVQLFLACWPSSAGCSMEVLLLSLGLKEQNQELQVYCLFD